jgi:hypothetical protein
MNSSQPEASVIIAIYKDTEALDCVLVGLSKQTEKNFEVIVTEDGNDFRNTPAVNRAIAPARSD